MFSLEALIEKYYFRILIFLFILGWLYLNYGDRIQILKIAN